MIENFAISRLHSSLMTLLLFGSKFPIKFFTDHNPILLLFTRKGNLTAGQNKAQTGTPPCY